MQRIQETGKMFENIDYVEWKGLELFYENEILEITIIYPKNIHITVFTKKKKKKNNLLAQPIRRKS